jgi:hypothetical protein
LPHLPPLPPWSSGSPQSLSFNPPSLGRPVNRSYVT